jgi:outer membrane protein OmpA-like peptidoglycan-associated protein
MNVTPPPKLVALACLFCLLLLPCAIMAQEGRATSNPAARRAFDRGLQAFHRMDYAQALEYAERAIGRDPGFADAHLLKAEVHSARNQYQESIPAYEAVVGLDPSGYPMAHHYLGLALMRTGRYEEAMDRLEVFLGFRGQRQSLLEASRKYISDCRFALQAMEAPVPFNPENLGPGVNTSLAEYSPALTIDGKTLIFTRRSPLDPTRPEGMEKEDFYLSDLTEGVWGPARSLGPPVNTDGNEGAQSISADGRELFFTACHRAGGYGSCDIYHARWQDGGWGDPVNLGPVINSPAWESQPSISSDGHSLYFASARSGSHGPMDLWVAVRDDRGDWLPPENLGPVINTTGREMSPFIHPDGHSLYFASDGHQGMGGLDLFLSRRDESGQWTEPVNLGYPINTHADEFGLIVDARGRTAFFASAIEGGNLDLYSFELPEEARPSPVAGIAGLAEGPGREADLVIVGQGEPVVLRNIFFDTDSHELKPESMEEIMRLFRLLQDNPGWKVEISGHTDNTGSYDHNLTLSENRARSVVDRLTELGVAPGRLQYRGHADTRPVDTNDTPEGRANNRRTEFTILEF